MGVGQAVEFGVPAHGWRTADGSVDGTGKVAIAFSDGHGHGSDTGTVDTGCGAIAWRSKKPC